MPPVVQPAFEAAARALADGTAPAEAAAAGLLAELGHDLAAPAAERRLQAGLLRLAARAERVFRLAAPDAPGLVFVGAALAGAAFGADPARAFSASGVGADAGAAFAACLGEALEIASQIERPGDVAARGAAAEFGDAVPADVGDWVAGQLAGHGLAAATRLDWVAGTRLDDGRAVLLPADLVLRRRPERQVLRPGWPASLGCGAGTTPAAALLHGLLERVERDCVALWWRGGRRGRALAADEPAQAAAAARLLAARAGRTGRPAWLLDITGDLGVPCVVALSCGADGRGVAAGMAARPSPAAAAAAAVGELCQIELALHLAEARLADGGEESLAAADRATLRRGRDLDTAACALLHPLPPAASESALPGDDPEACLAALAGRLAAAGLAAYGVARTHPLFAVPAAVVCCPGLEAEPGGPAGARLAAARRAHGGGEAYTRGISLL